MSRSVSMLPASGADDLERRLFAWALLSGVLLCGALAGPFYAGRIYTSDDLWAFHIPLRLFYAQCLMAGEAFDWSPHLFCGFYLSGEGQLGTYHPLHWLLYRTLPFRAALGLELLLSYPLMFAGGYWFLRRLVHDRAAACFGALVFAFSGFNLLHFVHPNAIAVVAHIPWLLCLLDVRLRTACRGTRAAADAGVALLTASQLLLGYPQYVWFSLLIEAAFVAYAMFDRRAETGTWWPAVFRLTTAKLLGLMMAAVQVLPTLDALATSQRQTVDAVFAQSGSLHPLNLLQLAAPYLFVNRVAGQNTHELGLYAGAVPLMLIVWLLSQRRHWGEQRRWTRFALAVAAVALLLALGSHGGLYTLQTYLPLVGKFRMPARHIVLLHLALAMLSGIALTMLIRQARERRQSSWHELGLLWRVAGASVVLALAAPWLWADYVAAPVLVWSGPLLMILAAAAVSLAARQARGAFVALIVLTALDLGVYGLSYAVYPNTMDLSTFLAAGPNPPAADADRIAAELRGPGADTPRAGNHLMVRGWRQVDGYAGLEPARQLDYRQLASLQAAGVRWVLNHDGAAKVAGLVPRDGDWLEVPQPLPRARLVNRVCVTDDPAGELAKIDLRSQALVQQSLPLAQQALGNTKLIEDRPGRLTVAFHSTGRQLLVVAESFHRGWQAAVDGVCVPVLRVNGDFLGCVVEPGRHEVTLAFQPWSLAWGRQLSLAGLALWAAWFVARLSASWVTLRMYAPPTLASSAANSDREARNPLSCDAIIIPANLRPKPCT